ncbi:hypothetical protein [Endozoicomonas lisbonensis]|uniref:Metallothionein n=1 Tax=Endozoicomonas lisbonensis TaxID=3120522 RepID=A0ABV2SR05_9GAMM
MCECQVCGEPATHIEVDYYHDFAGYGHYYCEKHAFQDGREQCGCCEDVGYEIEVGDDEFLPTYAPGSIDGDGCCSEHP